MNEFIDKGNALSAIDVVKINKFFGDSHLPNNIHNIILSLMHYILEECGNGWTVRTAIREKHPSIDFFITDDVRNHHGIEFCFEYVVVDINDSHNTYSYDTPNLIKELHKMLLLISIKSL